VKYFLAALLAFACGFAMAEKADKDKPTRIEANRMSSDETQRLNIFEGDVVLTKGTLRVTADRIVVREDAEGFQHSTATGAPVHFRQRQDAEAGKPAGWIDGEARRIEIDDSKSTVELFEDARVTRDGDEVVGDHIFVDQRSEFVTVNTGEGGPAGRVRATIQPKTPTAPAAAGKSPPAAVK
jgi:lipopolysaccharide export system protein LptA